MKIYMFNHWLEDQNENIELFKHHGYLVGSFINPEAVQKILNDNNVSLSDEEFDIASDIVRNTIEQKQQEEQVKPKRRRKRAN